MKSYKRSKNVKYDGNTPCRYQKKRDNRQINKNTTTIRFNASNVDENQKPNSHISLDWNSNDSDWGDTGCDWDNDISGEAYIWKPSKITSKKSKNRRNHLSTIKSNVKESKPTEFKQKSQIYQSYICADKVLQGIKSELYLYGRIECFGLRGAYLKVKNYDHPVCIQGNDLNRSFHNDYVAVSLYDESKWITKQESRNLMRRKNGKLKFLKSECNKDKIVINLDELDDNDDDLYLLWGIETSNSDKDVLHEYFDFLDMDVDEELQQESKELNDSSQDDLDTRIPTGKVIYVEPRNYQYELRGTFNDTGLFLPFNKRFPPFSIINKPEDLNSLKNRVYTVHFVSWDEYHQFPLGKIVDSFNSKSKNVHKQLKFLLSKYSIDEYSYPDHLVKNIPDNVIITEEELKERADYRNKVTITIDPQDAKDLDDAISIEELDNKHYKVGVHIADVTHYINHNDAIDRIARVRSTSYYFAHKTIHMLPEKLSSNICSLLPGKDRLCITVEWELDIEGNIIDTAFKKTIINSSARLSYDIVEEIIQSSEQKDICIDELNNYVVLGKEAESVYNSIILLKKLTSKIRKRRFNKGVLTLPSTRLEFRFTKNNMNYVEDFKLLTQESRSSHIVEELMIMANISVASKIVSSFPNQSILRYHPHPDISDLKQLKERLSKIGYDIDFSSIEAFTKSICKFDDVERDLLCISFANYLKRALYYRSNENKKTNETTHYALNINIYTHFTSPIRRYSDIIAHRILYNAIFSNKSGLIPISEEIIDDVCDISNYSKYIAKKSQEKCEELFLSRWLLKFEKFVDKECYILEIIPKKNAAIAFSKTLCKKVIVKYPINSTKTYNKENHTIHIKDSIIDKEMNIGFLSKVSILFKSEKQKIRGEIIWRNDA